MEYCTLKNGIKLIYEHRQGEITSLCIGFNAGALEEKGRFNFGTAHALEHLVSKGTCHRTENEINAEFDDIFGFENAMTNYPYTIYYGSCLSRDMERALELYSDILLNPSFPACGFKEEMNIILEELKEWHGDMYQYCEDTLFKNCFENRRIREIIIGSEKDIKLITLDDIKNFYKCFYTPDNCVISFSSSLDFELVCKFVEQYFGSWNTESNCSISDKIYEKNISGLYKDKLESLEGVKIQYVFDIGSLSNEEFKALLLFNNAFGQGTSSLLFQEIRTKNAAAYEIGSHIKNERGIKLLSINMGTSVEKVDKSISTINAIIDNITSKMDCFKQKDIEKLARRVKLKRELKLERSIQLCKELTTYELMYGDYKKLYEETENLQGISRQDIYDVIKKVIKEPSIQILN
ncbi:insulinase family protein [Clostridium tyrobutyricum]|uniref:M16 family metallopeptidase n=1 Tax=Clostridium tyrobutyricum TaxID=1519 RepID=UPI001C3946C5|nr:pitrilysin family protein [Clostridium tyrobutyricum]MBV4418569.1 insulinase family protein [Clostridium tyrobutyricum]